MLRCPVCRLNLTAAAGALVCRNRHSFDLARQGYVNLLLYKRWQLDNRMAKQPEDVIAYSWRESVLPPSRLQHP